MTQIFKRLLPPLPAATAPTVKPTTAATRSGPPRDARGRFTSTKPTVTTPKPNIKVSTGGPPGTGTKAPTVTASPAASKAVAETAKNVGRTAKLLKGAGTVLGRLAVPLTVAMSAFQVFSTENNENLDRTEKNIEHTKTAGGLGGAIGGAAVGAAVGSVVPVVGTIIGGLVGGAIGYFAGSSAAETIAEEVSSKTDTDNVSGNITLTQQEKLGLAKQAEKGGAVDIGRGHGDIDDLKKLSELEVDSLESLLDVETWKDDDLEMIKSIIAAKKEGREMIFKEASGSSKWTGGMFGEAESLEFGEAGSVGPTVTPQQGVDTSGAGVVTGDQPKPTMMEASDRLEKALDAAYMKSDTMDAGTQEYADLMNETARLERDLDELDMMSAEEFNALTPDSAIMDSFYKAGTTEGSIFVHDVHLLDFLKGHTGKMAIGGDVTSSDLAWKVNQENMNTGPAVTEGNAAFNADGLAESVVTATMQAEASRKEGGGNTMVAAPINNSTQVTNQINTSSTAHAPMSPAGMGHMGINTPRG